MSIFCPAAKPPEVIIISVTNGREALATMAGTVLNAFEEVLSIQAGIEEVEDVGL